MIRTLIYISLFVLAGCTLPEEKAIRAEMKQVDEPVVIETHDSNAAMKIPALPLPITPDQREPHGIYRGILTDNIRIEQTVAFGSDNTFRLQEIYPDNKDSIVIIDGTWAPSDGYIWLYKDQVVRARYKWEGPTLKYYNPVSKKAYPMQSVEDILENDIWKSKSKKGILFYGIGNEPFWNIEIRDNDSLRFALADWKEPLQFKISSFKSSGDTLAWQSISDSTQISITILPYFCSDGMSDYVYRNQVRVRFNNQVYNGCGTVYKP